MLLCTMAGPLRDDFARQRRRPVMLLGRRRQGLPLIGMGELAETVVAGEAEAAADFQLPASPASEVDRREKAIRAIFLVALFSTVFLQKLAVPAPGGPISILLVVLFAAYAGFCAVDGIRISVGRMLVYALTLAAAIIGQIASGRPFSGASVLLLFLTYTLFLFRFEISGDLMRRNLKSFQHFMVIGSGIALVQQVWQLTFGWRSFPNLEKIIPQPMILEGFVYIQDLYYGSPYIKPNGIFFLEVSFLSQFIAIALVIELVFFQKIWRVALFAGTLLAIFAGTGLLLLLLVSPLLAARLPIRRAILLGVIGAAVLVVALNSGWYDQIDQRFAELGDPSDSGYLRFVDPWVRLQEFATRPDAWYSGNGAGSTPKEPGVVWWAVTKLATEYGVLTAILFHVYFIGALMSRAPSYRLALTLLLWFSFMGSSLLTFPVIALCLLLGATFRLPPGEDIRIGSGRPQAA